MQSTQSSWDAKALTRGAPQTQRGRPWQSALKPQGGLVDKHNKGIMRALWVSQWYSYRDKDNCCKGVNHRKVWVTNANCNILPSSAGVKVRALNTTTATIVTVSMADANNNNNLQTATKQQQNNEAVVTHTPHVTRTTIAGQAGNQVARQSHKP
jgi:hypothetical protein